jgi:hypothetical protein
MCHTLELELQREFLDLFLLLGLQGAIRWNYLLGSGFFAVEELPSPLMQDFLVANNPKLGLDDGLFGTKGLANM